MIRMLLIIATATIMFGCDTYKGYSLLNSTSSDQVFHFKAADGRLITLNVPVNQSLFLGARYGEPPSMFITNVFLCDTNGYPVKEIPLDNLKKNGKYLILQDKDVK